MGFDENREEGGALDNHGNENEATEKISRQMSETSLSATEDETDDEGSNIELGPQRTLKEELEKDKVNLCSCFSHLIRDCIVISFLCACQVYNYCFCCFVVCKFRMMRVLGGGRSSFLELWI